MKYSLAAILLVTLNSESQISATKMKRSVKGAIKHTLAQRGAPRKIKNNLAQHKLKQWGDDWGTDDSWGNDQGWGNDNSWGNDSDWGSPSSDPWGSSGGNDPWGSSGGNDPWGSSGGSDPWGSPSGGDPWGSPSGGDPWGSPSGGDPWGSPSGGSGGPSSGGSGGKGGPPPDNGPAGPVDLEKFGQIQLDAHNKYRAMHGTPPMEYDAELAAGSQAWAEQLSATDSFEHSSANGYGENLAMNSEQKKLANTSNATDMWYAEVKDYDFSNPGNSQAGVVGHFTQIVWVGSTKLGCGVKGMYVCCRYKDAGNMMGDYENNVLPLV